MTSEVLTGDELVHRTRSLLVLVSKLASSWAGGPVSNTIDQGWTFEHMLLEAAPAGTNADIVGIVRDAGFRADALGGIPPQLTAACICEAGIATLKRHQAGIRLQAAGDEFAEFRDFIGAATDMRRRPTDEELSHLAGTCAEQATNAIMGMDAVRAAGPDGRVFFAVDDVVEPTVELQTGCCFDLVVPVMSCVGVDRWRRFDVRTLCIDGVCDEVSELDRVLMHAHTTGEPTVVFARKFGPDVCETVAANTKRGTLDVLLVVVPYDEFSSNILKDICVLTGGAVTTPLLGELISSIDPTTAPIVDEVSAVNESVVIQNDTTREAVDAHVAHIAARASAASDEVADIVMRRTRCLSARTVVVKFPQGNERAARDADRVIRYVRSAMTSGVVDVDHLAKPNSHTAATLYDHIMKLGPIIPMGSLSAYVQQVSSATRLLTTLGAAVS